MATQGFDKPEQFREELDKNIPEEGESEKPLSEKGKDNKLC